MLTCAAVFGAQALFVLFAPVRMASLYAGLLGVPLVNAVVMINAGEDAAGTLESGRARLERLLERTWAIIVLDVGITLIAQIGLESTASSDPLQTISGILVLFLAAMLVYAEPFACLEAQTQTLTLVPFALLRSMMLAWVNVSRIFSLFAVQIVVTILQLMLMRAMTAAAPHAVDLANLAYATLTAAPLAALFAVAYLDTLGQERSAAS